VAAASKTPPKEGEFTGLLEGIGPKTNKADLLKRLQDLAKQLGKQQDERVTKLRKIEEKVREKHTAKRHDLRQLMVTSPAQEWQETIEFLDEFVDDSTGETILPMPLIRLRDGARELLKEPDLT